MNVQFTYNNTMDMSGLAAQVDVLVASHATLFTMLQQIHDAKNEEKERRKNARYASTYRPTSRTLPPTAPLALPQREPYIEEVVEEPAPTTADALLEAQRKKWLGYKVPSWTDNKTRSNGDWKEELLPENGYTPERYIVSNMPIWRYRLLARERAKMTKDLNQKLQDEEDKRKKFLKDLDSIRKALYDVRRENPNLDGSLDQLRIILVRMMTESCVYFLDGMNANECLEWWKAGALPGRYLLEGFEAYFCVDLHLSLLDVRRILSEILVVKSKTESRRPGE